MCGLRRALSSVQCEPRKLTDGVANGVATLETDRRTSDCRSWSRPVTLAAINGSNQQEQSIESSRGEHTRIRSLWQGPQRRTRNATMRPAQREGQATIDAVHQSRLAEGTRKTMY